MFPTEDFVGGYLGRVGTSPNGRFPTLRSPNQEQTSFAENPVTREGQQIMSENNFYAFECEIDYPFRIDFTRGS